MQRLRTYLHQTKVEVHSRVAPDADGVVVSVSEGETRARPLSLSHSTMGDRDDVRIEFGCEFCGRLLWLEFKQHKGQTLVSWRDQGELWDGRCGGGW